jgi:hypothetical protein
MQCECVPGREPSFVDITFAMHYELEYLFHRKSNLLGQHYALMDKEKCRS